MEHDADSHADAAHELRSFGRRRGRKPSPRQSALLSDLLPRVRIDIATPPPNDIAAQRAREVPAGSDPPGQTPIGELWLEIGFGGGEHLVWQAARNASVRIIGCEPFEDGIVKVLSAIDTQGLDNIRLFPDDARPLLRWLPPASLARCFILFPDPWPKRRHVKRRLVSPATLALVARVLRPGAELRIATDIGDYARTILLAVTVIPQLRWLAATPSDWRLRPPDWPETRYEAKAIREGRPRYYFRFERTHTL